MCLTLVFPKVLEESSPIFPMVSFGLDGLGALEGGRSSPNFGNLSLQITQAKRNYRGHGGFNKDFTRALPTTGKIEGFQASAFFVAKIFWGENLG